MSITHWLWVVSDKGVVPLRVKSRQLCIKPSWMLSDIKLSLFMAFLWVMESVKWVILIDFWFGVLKPNWVSKGHSQTGVNIKRCPVCFMITIFSFTPGHPIIAIDLQLTWFLCTKQVEIRQGMRKWQHYMWVVGSCSCLILFLQAIPRQNKSAEIKWFHVQYHKYGKLALMVNTCHYT